MAKRKRKKLAARRAAQKPVTETTLKGVIIAVTACAIFSLLGFAFIWVGIQQIAFTCRCSAEAPGLITEVTRKQEYQSGKRSKTLQYWATYSYEIGATGNTDVLVTAKRFTAKPLAAGQRITIRYNPDNPGEKYVKGYDDAGNVFCVIVGIVWVGFFALIAYCAIVLHLREQAAKKQQSAV
ncbi:MAG: DUF3592 domain-containing protein [Oscillospiraceae bacterium]|nr:DUF3592 domain-containing protein [Oscillospiraceae bacterium]